MKQRMIQILGATALLTLLSGCGEAPSQPTSAPNPSSAPSAAPGESTQPSPQEVTPSADPDPQQVTIPPGARAASSDFPFPVPESWDEIDAFTEAKVGKQLAQYAAYAYPGDAVEAAEHYKALLLTAGYESYDDILGGMTNQAAIWVEGPINDVLYDGNITFDSYADGTQRAVIHLYGAD